MARTPLTRGPHAMRADRLAFATPVLVREAGRQGWITLHSADSDEGTVHVYVGSGGYIEKGPKALTHHHIGAIASHPSVARTTRHPAGHEPQGAREHPDFHEAGPKPRSAQQTEGQEPAKRPGKPYARLHGAEQGTRHQQAGKALSEAQEAAKGAKQRPDPVAAEHEAKVQAATLSDRHRQFFRDNPEILAAISRSRTPDELVRTLNLTHDKGLSREDWAKRVKMNNALHAAGALTRTVAGANTAHPGIWYPGQKYLREQAQAKGPAQTPRRAAALDQPESATARMADKTAASAERSGGRLTDMAAAKEQLRAKVEAARAAKAARQQQADVADTAVAHQQAQSELAAHRAAHDRNPNPWAPHLSPPVGDAKDRELAEKATRAQLAHQAAQAQQQGAQQQQQTAEQRAHEKEMVRLKAETAQPKPEVKALGSKPGKASPVEKATAAIAAARQEERTAFEARRANPSIDAQRAWQQAKSRVDQLESRLSLEHKVAAPGWQEHGAWRKQADEAILAGEKGKVQREKEQAARTQRAVASLSDEQKAAFSTPQAKEQPQTAPQPQQAAGASAPSAEHRAALREGRRLLAHKALDPEAHKAKVELALHKATAADPFGGARLGYARHGSEYAQRLAHLEAASHYQNHANALQRQHLAMTNQDTGGVLAKAQRHIEVLTHHEQRAQGQTHPQSDQQARELLARSQAIGRHYTSAVQHLNAKAQEHRDAHARLRRSPPVRESASPAPPFSAPAMR